MTERKSHVDANARHRFRESKERDLRQKLTIDYGIDCLLMQTDDFGDGVRALLIDTDGAPHWRTATIADVTPGMIER